MKSGCVYAGSEKYVKSPVKMLKKTTSKEKGKQLYRSPSLSGNELTMRFKKKKTGQVAC